MNIRTQFAPNSNTTKTGELGILREERIENEDRNVAKVTQSGSIKHQECILFFFSFASLLMSSAQIEAFLVNISCGISAPRKFTHEYSRVSS